MVRNYKRKTHRVRKTGSEMEAAVNEVLVQGQSIRSVSKQYGIAKSYLARKIKMYKEIGEGKEFTHKPNIGNRRVFTSEQETELASYLVKAAKISHGLTAVQTRTLVYE